MTISSLHTSPDRQTNISTVQHHLEMECHLTQFPEEDRHYLSRAIAEKVWDQIKDKPSDHRYVREWDFKEINEAIMGIFTDLFHLQHRLFERFGGVRQGKLCSLEELEKLHASKE